MMVLNILLAMKKMISLNLRVLVCLKRVYTSNILKMEEPKCPSSLKMIVYWLKIKKFGTTLKRH